MDETLQCEFDGGAQDSSELAKWQTRFEKESARNTCSVLLALKTARSTSPFAQLANSVEREETFRKIKFRFSSSRLTTTRACETPTKFPTFSGRWSLVIEMKANMNRSRSQARPTRAGKVFAQTE